MTRNQSAVSTTGRKTRGHQLSVNALKPMYSTVNATYMGLREKRYGPVTTNRDAGRSGMIAVRARKNVSSPHPPSTIPNTQSPRAMS